MNEKKSAPNWATPRVDCEPAFNVAVYRSPGPDDDAIGLHARTIAATWSTYGCGGGVAYLTLVKSDFDRLWKGVDQGDAYGTAYSVLKALGPLASQFIGRPDDFIIGWVGGPDKDYGDVLLLQIISRPHLLVSKN